MKRNLLSLKLTAIMLLACSTLSAETFELDGINFGITSSFHWTAGVFYKINSQATYSGTIVIPENVSYLGKNYTVTEIGPYSFLGCRGMTDITIPSSVYSFGNSAFEDCTGLTSIEIPERVSSLNYSVFKGCTGLTKITIPGRITSIDNTAFIGCSGLDSITVSPENMYFDDKNSNAVIETLTRKLIFGCSSTIIPNGVLTIEEHAFDGRTGLKSITIPESVTAIGDYAFDGCAGLSSIKVDKSNKRYDSRNNCNGIIETATNSLIFGCSTTIIPNSVTNIVSHAFDGRTGLVKLSIPGSVTTIGDYAFAGCSGLSQISLPNSLTALGNYVFANCTSLNKVTIPNRVTALGNYLFANCTELTDVTIPNSVTAIGNYAFHNCRNLNNVRIPSGVSLIGNFAFYSCTGMTEIICDAVVPPCCGERVFGNVDKISCTLVVPKNCSSAYRYAEQWKDFIHIIER